MNQGHINIGKYTIIMHQDIVYLRWFNTDNNNHTNTRFYNFYGQPETAKFVVQLCAYPNLQFFS